MTGSDVAALAHENRHHVEVEVDRPIHRRFLDGHGHLHRLVSHRHGEFGAPVFLRNEIVAGLQSNQRRIREGKGRIRSDVDGCVVFVGGHDDNRLLVPRLFEDDVLREGLHLHQLLAAILQRFRPLEVFFLAGDESQFLRPHRPFGDPLTQFRNFSFAERPTFRRHHIGVICRQGHQFDHERLVRLSLDEGRPSLAACEKV